MLTKEHQITLLGLTLKALVAHTVTYFVIGLMALTVRCSWTCPPIDPQNLICAGFLCFTRDFV